MELIHSLREVKIQKPQKLLCDTSLLLLGLTGLLLGTIVYLSSRSPDQTYFIHRLGLGDLYLKNLVDIFGPLSGYLPSFLHPLSFILITSAFIPKSLRLFTAVSAGWLLINVLFEIGQLYKSTALKLIPSWFANIPFLENTEGFFRYGTFDHKDLIAAIAGSAIAYGILTFKVCSRGAR